VELAAVVTMPSLGQFAPAVEFPEVDSPISSIERAVSLLPILGNKLLQIWTDRIRGLGLRSLWLTSCSHDALHVGSDPQDPFRQGVERLLVINLASYAEMDLDDMLHFHCQNQSMVTEACDSNGWLGVSILNCSVAVSGRNIHTHTESSQVMRNAYPFRGYAKRIISPKERQELVADGLTGTCAMRPLGSELAQQVWIGENASLASSARVVGPSYIGDRTIVREGATIGPFASVEHDCVVDYGTTVEHAAVLPYTHLAPGLRFRKALADGGHLQDLESGTIVNLEAGCLAHRIPSESPRETHGLDVVNIASREGETAWRCPSTEWRQVKL